MSVIIPAYNYGRFIASALESVLAQSYRDFEIIVVDDGSTDDTRRRVEAFGTAVRYIYQSNAGLSAACNAGIEASRGGLIALLDADDIWLPTKLEQQVARMAAEPAAGLGYCWWRYMDEAGVPLPDTARPVLGGQALEALLRGGGAVPSTWMVPRTCLDRVGLFDPALYAMQDWDLMLRIAKAGYVFACVPEILTCYRVHDNQMSGNYVRMVQSGRRSLAKALSQLAPDARRTRLRKAAYFNHYTSAAIQAAAERQPTHADAWLAKAVRLDRGVCRRPAFYLRLAVDLLPFGRRTVQELASRLDAISGTLAGLTARLFSATGLPGATAEERQAARSALYLALAILYGRCGRWGRAAEWLGRSLAAHPLTAVAALGRGARHWRAVRSVMPIFRGASS